MRCWSWREPELVGIVSERDYARKVILKGRSSEDTRVADIMTAHVLYVHPDETVDDCMALMTEKRIRHLPIVEKEQVIGVLSLGDLVKAVIAEQKFMIDQLGALHQRLNTGAPAAQTIARADYR